MTEADRPTRHQPETLLEECRRWQEKREELADHIEDTLRRYFHLRSRVEAARARRRIECRLAGEDPEADPVLAELEELSPPSRADVEDAALAAVRDAKAGAPNLHARARLLGSLEKATRDRPLDRFPRRWGPAVGAAVRSHPGSVPEDLEDLLGQLRERAEERDAAVRGCAHARPRPPDRATGDRGGPGAAPLEG